MELEYFLVAVRQIRHVGGGGGGGPSCIIFPLFWLDKEKIYFESLSKPKNFVTFVLNWIYLST